MLMVLLIRDEDIKAAEITPRQVIEAVENAYRQDGMGLAFESPRFEIQIKGRHLPHIAPGTTSVRQGMAYLEGSKAFVIFQGYSFSWHKSVSHIIDPDDGETLAMILRTRKPFGVKTKELNRGGYRTGAAAAIGAKYLANESVDAVGVIGTGRVGRACLVCMDKVREFEKVYAHSGTRRDDEFSQDMSALLGIDVIASESPEEVVRNSNLLITATYATEPVVKGEWLREGTHISGMGADGPLKAELDATTVKRANKIVIDSQKCLSIGEIARPMEKGIISLDDIHGKIGEVVAGVKPGRERPEEITIFESDGTNIQSAAVVWLIYNKVKEAGLGIETSERSPFFINP
jgi:ornithine cyclodeaminase/alanine dehydrogenase-like protein (mu-crystallin family)